MTVLKWFGGKHYLAKRIIELMPPHTHYAEPFFGGGAVLFAKDPEGISETVNDINRHLQNFWNAVKHKDSFLKLHKLLASTPLSEITYDVVKMFQEELTKNEKGWYPEFGGEIVKPWDFFIRYRQSRQALGKDYVTPTRRTRRGMNEQVSAWLSAVEGLPEAHERLIRVEIRNMNAVDFIRKYDHEDCLFYCDPPYMHETRTSTETYENEMSETDHSTLLQTLAHIKGKFVLSGYRSQVYDWFANEANWHRRDIKIDNKASSAKVKEIKTECLWTNYAPSW